MEALFMVIFAYLLGSIPTGFVLGYLSGVDVRQAGSGNVGATNVARVVGRRQGLITLLADVAKGFVPVFLSFYLGLYLTIGCVVALAAFLGHLYPVFLRFRGGKGVATALGIFLSLAPMATMVIVFVFAFVAMVSRMVSLASLIAALFAPLALWFFAYPPILVWLSLLIGLLVILRHRENMERLISGAEPRFDL
ncbi:MAG: glycerol-3-phosphate 1-O-acyltransferase PlsY [Deltaproteobacteria bacterium]|nr:glycerol-3-phosphate 1-O-acyltransferase PlsY [Deltaproteobacteria bacterium]